MQEKRSLYFKVPLLITKLFQWRHQQVDIIKRTYKGIKVPKEAIRLSGGKEGVYVISGSRAVFKEVTRLFETNSFYIVKADGTDDRNLFIYDKNYY